MRQTLPETKWPQPNSPIQTENSAAVGVVNNTILPRKLKTMDCCLHWLRCIEARGQFCYYWASGNLNWGGGITKHHPPLYDESKIMPFQDIRTASKTSGPSKVPARVYCSWFQVERTSTWNPHMHCTYRKARTKTYPRIAISRQHGGHKITT